MSETILRFGVIGAGRMGALHARVLSEMAGVDLAGVVDTDGGKAKQVAEKFGCQALEGLDDLKDIDAAVVAVPTSHHLPVALKLLAQGIHLLVEKPLAGEVAAGEQMLRAAGKAGVLLQVGHTERFNPIVWSLQSQPIEAKFIECQRVSPFSFRSMDIGVVLDMMIHDIDIVQKLAGAEVKDVQAVGVNVMGETEDVANVRLRFANGCVANLTASRLALKTDRRIRVFSSDAYLSLNFQGKNGIVVRKNPNLDLVRILAEQRQAGQLSDITQLDWTGMIQVEEMPISDHEPLVKQAECFCESIREGTPPVVSGEDGLENIRLAHRILSAIKAHRWDGTPTGRVGLGDHLGGN